MLGRNLKLGVLALYFNILVMLLMMVINFVTMAIMAVLATCASNSFVYNTLYV